MTDICAGSVLQCLANVYLPIDVTLLDNIPAVELLEWLRDNKDLKAFKGAKASWTPANLEQERHRSGEFPRIGSFEVFVISSYTSKDKGLQCSVQEVYSKLGLGRWPTPQFLASKLVKILAKVKRREGGCLQVPWQLDLY